MASQKLSRFSDISANLHDRLLKVSPTKHIKLQNHQLIQLTQQLLVLSKLQLQVKKSRFSHIIEQLHLVSPLATIARGYSVARDEKNDIVRSVSQITAGSEITLQLSDGVVTAKVIEAKM